jgi:hypothetical protein
MKLTRKQFLLRKLAACRVLAKHLGMIPSCKALTPGIEEYRQRVAEFGDTYIPLAFWILVDDRFGEIGKAAAASMLDFFSPDWRDTIHPSLLGPCVLRDDPKVRLWRDSVFCRDGYVCVNCGSRESLEAHHINRWVDAPSLRLDIDNGVTLCKRCHQERHHA